MLMFMCIHFQDIYIVQNSQYLKDLCKISTDIIMLIAFDCMFEEMLDI